MPNTQIKKKRRRRYAAPIGGVFVVLAVIGVITVVVASIRLTVNFLDNSREKEMFADLIHPVAMFDPPPFEDPANIKMEELLRYSMWATLKSEKRSTYEYGDNAELTVPATDLDVACARLFGPEIQLVHQSFGIDYENRYVYDDETNVYTMPVPSLLLVYTPEVADITKDGEFLNLLVDYIPPADAFTDSAGPEKDKSMIYVMRDAGDSYLIAKVRDVPTEESSSAAGTAQQQPPQP